MQSNATKNGHVTPDMIVNLRYTCISKWPLAAHAFYMTFTYWSCPLGLMRIQRQAKQADDAGQWSWIEATPAQWRHQIFSHPGCNALRLSLFHSVCSDLSDSHMWNKTEIKHCFRCSIEMKQFLILVVFQFYFRFRFSFSHLQADRCNVTLGYCQNMLSVCLWSVKFVNCDKTTEARTTRNSHIERSKCMHSTITKS